MTRYSRRPIGEPGAPLSPADAVAAAYTFLDDRVPLDASGETTPGTRSLPRSYTAGHLGAIGFDVAFSYDCALVALAYLARGNPADRLRAMSVGDTILALQRQDPAADGRLRNSYTASPALGPRGPSIASAAATTGNQAWVGLALVRLWRVTGEDRFLDGAVRVAEHVRTTAHDLRGNPAFSGGVAENGSALRWRSTEHNIDCSAFFTRLHESTGESRWKSLAGEAGAFVRSMWDPEGFFRVGTLDDGITPNLRPVAEDTQTWSALALADPSTSGSLDWANEHLAAQDGALAGVTVCDVASTDMVWLEGTAHLASALDARASSPAARPGDRARSVELLGAAWLAQAAGPHADGRGIPAASADGLDSGFGDLLYASLHTGATAWAVLAAQGVNPFAG